MSSLLIAYIKRYIYKYSNINIKNINIPVGMQTCYMVGPSPVIIFFQVVHIRVCSVSTDLVMCT